MNTPTTAFLRRRTAERKTSRQTSVMVLALGALSVLGTVAVIALSLWRSHVQVTNLGTQTVENLARVIEEQNVRMIQSGGLILSAVVDKLDNTPLSAPERSAQISAFLKDKVAASQFVRALWMRDENGDIVYDSDAFPAVKNRKTPDYFIALRDFPDSGLVISPPTAAFRGTVVSVLSLRVSKPDGAFGGVISAAIDPKFFQATYDAVEIGPHGMIAMLFDDGTLAALSPEAPTKIGRSFASEPPFTRMRNGGTHGIFRSANFIDSTARIYSFRRLAQSPLIVVVGWGENDLFADWRRTETTGAIVVLVFLLSIAALTLFTLHQATRLRESEEIFETAFRSSPVAIAVVTLDGRYVEVNPEWTSLLGYSREEMIGQTAVGMGLITAADQEKALLEGERAGSGSEPLETVVRRRDGSSIDVLTTHAPVTLRGVPHRLSTTMDITVRKQAEATRFEREQEFEALVENTPDIISRFNRKFRHLYVNRAVTRATGLPASAFIGKTHQDLGMPHDLQVVWHDILEDVFVRGEEREMEYEFPTPDGPRFYQSRLVPEHAPDGSIRSVLNIARDITGPKQAELALRESEARLRKLSHAVEQSPASIVIADAAGNIEYINPTCARITGYSFEEMLGQNLRMQQSGEVSASTYEQLWTTITAGKEWRGDLHNRKKNGDLYWESVSVSPIRDAAGNITNFLAVKEDTTARRELEDQFRQSQRMEGIGRLAGGVAHDFNNILAAIRLEAGLLKNGEHVSPEQAELADDIGEAVERGAALTRQLLLFSRNEVLREQDLDLNRSVEGLMKMLHRTIGEDIQMQVEMAGQPMFLRADAAMMDQMLLNLVLNARDAMPTGGKLVIATSPADFDEHAASQSADIRPGSFVCLSVSDAGCGIPPEIMPKIFEPFFTTKVVGKGTGLGLATVFGIVQQHHGWIDVDSEVGRGTTFRIYLPRREPLAEVKSSNATPTALHGGQETILLVEDDSAVRVILKRSLSRLGYKVLAAADGNEALALWRDHRNDIDLVLTDMVMPGGINGIELGAQLLNENPKIKVIYMSGYNAEVGGNDFPLKEGVNFIHKPFQSAKLAQTVRGMLDGESTVEHLAN